MNNDKNSPTAQTKTAVVFGDDAREQLQNGLNIAAAAVGSTLGPKGKTVLIQNGSSMPTVTKDGVSVARAIRLNDPIEAMGADLIKEAASRTMSLETEQRQRRS